MKRIIFLSLILVLVLPSLVSANNNVSVVLDGEIINFDTKPFIDQNSRTLVPARNIFESLGAKVKWNEELREVTITKDDLIIKLTIGSNIAQINNEDKELDTEAIIKDSRTFIPLRFVIENIGLNVNWDNETRTVLIGETDINKLKSKYVKETLYNDKIVATDDWSKETVTIVPPTKESIETFNKVINIIAENEEGNYKIGIHKNYGASILVGENDLNLKYYIAIEDKPNQMGDIYISSIKDFSNETVKKYKEVLKVIFPTEHEKVYSKIKYLYDNKIYKNYNETYKADNRDYRASYDEISNRVNIFIGEKVK